jgi:hypothetical protein
LAATVEVADTLCPSKDIRLSTAALLGSRFPYVSPSGHLDGNCRGATDKPDVSSPCATVPDDTVCDVDLVDGGYTDNSGLFSIAAIWPSLNGLVARFNSNNPRKIALVVVEIDNHYRTVITRPPQAGKNPGQILVPPTTAMGARHAIEAYARAVAYRLARRGCGVAILPGLHPGMTAPLGWELSDGARTDLRQALVRAYRSPQGGEEKPVEKLRLLQRWLKPGGHRGLERCLPRAEPRLR